MANVAPDSVIREAAFRNETMDMRIPFERAAEGVKNADKPRDKVFGLVEVMKHTKDNTTDCLKEAAKE